MAGGGEWLLDVAVRGVARPIGAQLSSGDEARGKRGRAGGPCRWRTVKDADCGCEVRAAGQGGRGGLDGSCRHVGREHARAPGGGVVLNGEAFGARGEGARRRSGGAGGGGPAQEKANGTGDGGVGLEGGIADGDRQALRVGEENAAAAGACAAAGVRAGGALSDGQHCDGRTDRWTEA